ncbi:MAG TPA: sulfotransferase [Acidimicrobiia bacterium]|nr:sulfotransferase [Acidimicrobiia bacterium]
MDVDQLLAGAIEQTGLREFGPEVDAMLEALHVLVRSADDDAGLTPEGDAAFGGMIGSLLTRRLEIEDWYARHPEIGEQEVESVLFGVGLPRTGSTALSYLLAQDREVRCLRQWESNHPTPPPDIATEDSDPRFLAAQQAMGIRDQVPSELKSMLPSSPDGPAECLDLMSMTFRCMALDVMAKTPSYAEWLYACDFGPAYRYHHRVVKLLQWRRPPSRWRLKTPAHLLSIEALNDEYPEARFVTTHRDVTKVIPSVASVETAVVNMMTGNADPVYIGHHCADTWDLCLRRFIAFRDRVGEDRFYDIGFDDFQSDPVGSIRKLYEWLGEDFTPATEDAMQRWWKNNEEEREQSGPHRYRAEDFGLDTGELAERFAYYAERFPIAAPKAADRRSVS